MDRTSAQKMEIINHDDPEVTFSPKNSARAERATKHNKIMTKIAKWSLHDSGLQQRSKCSRAKPLATLFVKKNKTEEGKSAERRAREPRRRIGAYSIS